MVLETQRMKVVTFIFKDIKKTEFMRQFDLFEIGKVLIMPSLNATLPDSWGKEELYRVVNGSFISHDFQLIGCVSQGVILYQDESVISISNGFTFMPFDLYLMGNFDET